MGSDPHEEMVNVYDSEGAVVGAQRRPEAKASGLAVGAVNALVLNGRGQALLQKRPDDKENGGRWDKSVGGHVSAGEDFDQTVVREAAEELFDDPGSGRVRLARDEDEFAALLRTLDLTSAVVLHRVALQRNLRDVRVAPGGGVRNVLYHVAIYLGRTEIPIDRFRPQPSEIVDLRYFDVRDVDEMLLAGRLAPNMAFLWLAQGHALVTGRR